MVELTALWLPIVLSAVLVFVASSIIHMVLPYHKGDFAKLPDEEGARNALRTQGVEPGDYVFPHAASAKDMGSPEMIEKYTQGPNGLLTVMPSGPPAMGKNLVMWFVFCLVIGVFVAYMTSRTLETGKDYWPVFRIAGTVAFLGYAAAQATDSIWMGRRWSTTLKHMFDGLVYAVLTAGPFAGFWPE